MGRSRFLGSFDVLEPDSSSSGDFKVWAVASWALDVGVCGFGDEVYGFLRGWVEVLPAQCPCVAAVSALQRGSGFGDVELGVLEVGWFLLLECEAEDFAFNLLEFTDFYVDFRDFGEFLFLGDFRSCFQNCFGKCPFMHEKGNARRMS